MAGLHTLVFDATWPIDADLTALRGRVTTCGLGIVGTREQGAHRMLDELAPDHGARAREVELRLLRRLATSEWDGATIWDLFRDGSDSYAPFVTTGLMMPLRYAADLVEQITGWLVRHRPARVQAVGLPRTDHRRALVDDICRRAAGLEVRWLRPPPSKAVPAGAVRPEGAYDYQGSLGREAGVMLSGRVAGFDPVPPFYADGLATLRTRGQPIFVTAPVAGGAVALEVSVQHLAAEQPDVFFEVGDGWRRATVVFGPGGLRAEDGDLAVADTSRLGRYLLWLDGAEAGIAVRGGAAAPLVPVPDERPAAARFGHRGRGASESRWRAAIALDGVARDVLDEKLAAWRGVADRQKPPGPLVAMIVPGTQPRAVRLPGGAPGASHMYYTGLDATLGTWGIAVVPIVTAAAWRVGGTPVKDLPDVFLGDVDLQEPAPDLPFDAEHAMARLVDAVVADPDFSHRDVPLAPVVAHHAPAFARVVRGALANNRRLRAVLSTVRPAAVTGPRLSTYRWAAYAAQAAGVPSLGLEISPLIHEERRLHVLAGEPEPCDVTAVWGSLAVEELKAAGMWRPEVAVTGLHTLDFHRALERPANAQEQAAMWRQLGFTGLRPPVLLFGSSLGGRRSVYYMDADEYAAALAALAAAAEQVGGWVVVKPRPLDDFDTIARIVARLGSDRVRVLDVDPPEDNSRYLIASDLVVANPTTLLAESIAAGIPTISALFATTFVRKPHPARTAELLARIAPVAHDPAHLTALAVGMLSDPRPPEVDEEAFAQLFGRLDGRVGERIRELLEPLVTISSTRR